MEEIASQGYVVVSPRHDTQDIEYAKIQSLIPSSESITDKKLIATLASSDIDRATRNKLTLEQIQNSTGMPKIVARRAADSQFILIQLPQIMSENLNCAQDCIQLDKFAAIGLSTGGAVATEFCKLEEKCGAVVNLDGGLFMKKPLEEINIPYLMMYSEFNNGSNDFFKPLANGSFEDQMIVNSKHMNFHDIGYVIPLARYVGLIGKISETDMRRQTHSKIVTFFNKHLKKYKPLN